MFRDKKILENSGKSKSERNTGLGGTDLINQDRNGSKEGREGKRERVESREMGEGVDGVEGGYQQVRATASTISMMKVRQAI